MSCTTPATISAALAVLLLTMTTRRVRGFRSGGRIDRYESDVPSPYTRPAVETISVPSVTSCCDTATAASSKPPGLSRRSMTRAFMPPGPSASCSILIARAVSSAVPSEKPSILRYPTPRERVARVTSGKRIKRRCTGITSVRSGVGEPSRLTLSWIDVPGSPRSRFFTSSTSRGFTSCPSTARMRSPARTPASYA